MDIAKELRERIEKNARLKKGKKRDVCIAPHSMLHEFSRESGRDRSVVDREVLAQGCMPERYSRNMMALSPEEQERICLSRVAQIGLGGLGGHVLELLARAGVGSIRACDGDVFEPSNLNRQLLCTENTLGIKKAEAAYERAMKVNPSILIDVHSDFLKGEDFNSFFTDAEVAVDCLGGLEHRNDVKEAAARISIPMVTASVAGWTGMVSTVMPGQVSPIDFFSGGEGLEEDLGTQGPSIGVAAGVQCSEILRILTGRGPGLAGKVLLFDLMGVYFDIVEL